MSPRALASLGISLCCATAALAASSAPIYRARLSAIVHPVAADFLKDAIAKADAADAAALVIDLDTPGGLLTSTREISTAMLGARTPIVVYVAPSGAQAASAGFFLLMAADVAAMAPGTNTGAAHPVGGQGETIAGIAGEKAEQDAAATIRALAGRNRRNVEVAEAAVVSSRSFTAQEALDQNLIDLIAADFASLLAALDGREVRRGEGTVVLRAAGAPVIEIEMKPVQRLLSALAHPNIAYLLLSLGFLGLYFEMAHPGAVLPGVVGALALVLGFFALSVLPVNYAGVALIALGLLFLLAEIKVTSYGMLTVAGVGSLALGSVMLFRSADPALRVSMDVILAITVTALVVSGFLVTMSLRAQRAPVRTGREGLISERGVVWTQQGARDKVFVHGEIWEARADEPLAPGDQIQVLAVEGSALRVRRTGPAPRGEQS